jgi:hypothetical protein
MEGDPMTTPRRTTLDQMVGEPAGCRRPTAARQPAARRTGRR